MKKKKIRKLLALFTAGVIALSVISTAWAETTELKVSQNLEETKEVEDAATEKEVTPTPEEHNSEETIEEQEEDKKETVQEDPTQEEIKSQEETKEIPEEQPEKDEIKVEAAKQADYGPLTKDGAVISGVRINKIVDGTPVWDEDNQPGNDRDGDNRIVRSYDTVTYTLAYTTEIKDKNADAFTEGDVYCRFVLPFTSEVGEFLTSSMKWLLDPEVKVEEGKTILTGRRHLARGNAPCAIPGAGTLSVVVRMNGAPNMTLLEPEFTLWFDGNAKEEQQSIVCNQNPRAELGNEYVTVSAAPGYNIKLVSAGRNQTIENYNPKTGKTAASPIKEVTRTGYLDKYVVVLQLANEDSRKQLKGMERPKGTISFDLQIEAKKQPFNGELTVGTTPLLWDYKNNCKDSKTTGCLDRDMTIGVGGTAFYEYAPTTASPKAKLQMTQEGKWIHVTLEDYEFSNTLLNGPYSGNTGYLDHTYAFYAGYVQFVVDAPSGENTDFFSILQDGNLKAVSLTDQSLVQTQGNENQTVLDDDHLTTQNIILSDGNMRKWQYPFAQSNANASSWYRNGTMADHDNMYTEEARAIGTFGIYRGQYFQLETLVSGLGIKKAYSANMLQKFDDEALAFDEDAVSTDFKSWFANPAEIRMLFAAKPDGSGWISDKEMESTGEEQLQFFSTMAELSSQNRTCVGVLYEVRGRLYTNESAERPCINLAPHKLKVKDTAKVGNVYQCVNDVLLWNEKNQLAMNDSVLGGTHPKSPTWTMKNGTKDYPSYVKTSYGADGSQKAGSHTGGAYSGQSVRILSNYTKVETSIDQHNENGTPKISFDVAAGQRQVDYVITPYLAADAEIEQETDTLTVTMSLPKGLTYEKDSCYQGGIYQQDDTSVGSGHLEGGTHLEPTLSEDGLTLTWVLENQQVNQPIESIHFSAFIGDETNQENDVKNGDAIKCTATSHSTSEITTPSYGRGSKASISLNVVKMTDLSIVKTVDKNLVECEESFSYTITCANTSQSTDFSGVKIMDILPWSGDDRESTFHGAYTIDGLKIAHPRGEEIDIYYTKSEDVREKNAESADLSQEEWVKAEKTGTYDYAIDPQAVAFAATGNLRVNDIIPITYMLHPTDNQGGDIYGNTVTMSHPKLAATVKVPAVRTVVQERRLSGLVWDDTDQDGIWNKENPIQGVKVSLLDAEGNPVTDIYEQEIASVYTDEKGEYSFRKLKDLEYQVVFESGEKIDLEEWKASPTLVKEADENQNSDGVPKYEGEKLVQTSISKITFEEVNETNPVSERVHLDQGLYRERIEPTPTTTPTPSPTKTPTPTTTPEDKKVSPTPVPMKENEEPPKGTHNAKTGDGSPILAFVLLLSISGLVITAVQILNQLNLKKRPKI